MVATAVGLIGSFILVAGVALPVRTVRHPALLPKNQLFTVGNLCMFAYSYLNFLNGGEIFFVFLQCLVAVSTLLMMLNIPDKYDAPILTAAGAILLGWSLSLFQDYTTILFVVGLVTLGIGFALNTGTFRRNIALAIGSGVIAIFSYLVQDWIFVGLNVFFFAFSGWWAWKLR